MLPTARFLDAGTSPKPGCAVEIKESAAAAACRLFEKKMAVEKHRLHARQQGIAAIQMTPARLDHAYFGISKKMDRPFQQIRSRNEISIQDADKLAFGGRQPHGKRTRLETRPVDPPDKIDIKTSPAQLVRA